VASVLKQPFSAIPAFLPIFPAHSRLLVEERAGESGHGTLAKDDMEPLASCTPASAIINFHALQPSERLLP
jgi:hypothetical protein